MDANPNLNLQELASKLLLLNASLEYRHNIYFDLVEEDDNGGKIYYTAIASDGTRSSCYVRIMNILKPTLYEFRKCKISRLLRC